MTPIRLGVVLAGAVAIAVPTVVAAQGPQLDVTIVHLVPGPQQLRVDQRPFLPEDGVILERYGVSGSIVGTVHIRVESPTGLDSRMIVFIQRPLLPDEREVRLPVPDSATDFVSQQEQRCWQLFPADTVHRLEHFVTLQMEPLAAGATELHMTFQVVGANGDVQRGVAARWSAAAFPKRPPN